MTAAQLICSTAYLLRGGETGDTLLSFNPNDPTRTHPSICPSKELLRLKKWIFWQLTMKRGKNVQASIDNDSAIIARAQHCRYVIEIVASNLYEDHSSLHTAFTA